MIDLDKDTESTDFQPRVEEITVNWKNKPTVRQLKQDLEDAKPMHTEHVQQVEEYLDNYHITGSAKLPKRAGSSNIQPKLIRKQAEWRYPALSEPFLSQDDIFKAKPVSWEDTRGAKQNEILLNNQFNNAINKVKFIDEYVRTAVDEGTVILRTGWEYVEEKYVDDFPVVEFRVNPEFAPMHEHLAEMQQNSPNEYNLEVPEELKMAHEVTMESGNPIEPVITGYKTEERVRVLVNRPTVEICDFRNTVIDPTCNGDISKAQFVVRSFPSSLSQLKKDGKYKNLDKIPENTNSPLSEPDFGGNDGTKNFQFSDEPRKKLVVYEYWGFWDIDGSGEVKPIVAAWVGDVLIRLEENPYPDKELPFILVPYLPVRNNNYGEPDGALLVDNQKLIGAVTRGAVDLLAKSANSQTGMRKDMLDSSNLRKFQDGQDYMFNGGIDPSHGIHMHKFPEIPNAVPQMLMMQTQEAESLTGVNSFGKGISGASLGEVAAGVRGALDAASKREVAILRRLADGIVAIGRKWMSMNAEFLTEEQVVRVTNEEFVTIKRDDLAGRYDIKLTISTAEEDEKKAQEMAFMLQTMGNNMSPDMSKMILSKIAYLRKMPDLAKEIETYQPQPDPVAQKLQELEIAKIEAEIAETRAKTAAHYANAGLSNVKQGTEQAKARHLGADADKKDLDFVEQESGVTQARELERVGEQARSQAKLKVIDHKLEMERIKNDPLKKYKASKK
jgi:hypothetical protein